MNSKTSKQRSAPRTGDFTSSLTATATTAEIKNRPSSAPAASTQETLSLVEQRLRIVKRNRTRNVEETAIISGTAPPVCGYPVFDLTRPSKSEQQAVEVVVREVLDCILFPDVGAS